MPVAPSACSARHLHRVLVAAGAAGAVLAAAGCTDTGSDPAATGAAPSTVRVAANFVLGNDHEPEHSCGPTAPADPGAADPQRIVAVGVGALDTVCALGLQDRVVAVSVDGPAPRYLGSWAEQTPMVGPVDQIDAAAVRAAAPDLIVVDAGPDRPAPAPAPELAEITRVAVAEPAADWTGAVTATGEALGRGQATAELIADYRIRARDFGDGRAAGRTQVSLLRFTDGSVELLGPASFAGQVLADTGLVRPAAQRFTDAPTETITPDDLSAVEADYLFVMFAGKNTGLSDSGGIGPAERYGRTVIDSAAWTDIEVTGAGTWIVDDHVWFAGGGLVAAGLIVDDLHDSF